MDCRVAFSFPTRFHRVLIVGFERRAGIPIRKSTEIVHEIMGSCSTLLIRIQAIRHELLYSASLVSAITAHPALKSVEVIVNCYGHDDSRQGNERLPCTPLFKYDFTSHSLLQKDSHIDIPELRDPEMYIYRLTIEGSLNVLASCRRIFLNAFILRLGSLSLRNPSQIVSPLLAFVSLQSCQLYLEFDMFDLFIASAHCQSPSLPQPTKEDIKHLALFSSLWKWPGGAPNQNSLMCEQIFVRVSTERDIQSEFAFSPRLLPYVPILKVLCIDLGYYVGKGTERIQQSVVWHYTTV